MAGARSTDATVPCNAQVKPIPFIVRSGVRATMHGCAAIVICFGPSLTLAHTPCTQHLHGTADPTLPYAVGEYTVNRYVDELLECPSPSVVCTTRTPRMVTHRSGWGAPSHRADRWTPYHRSARLRTGRQHASRGLAASRAPRADSARSRGLRTSGQVRSAWTLYAWAVCLTRGLRVGVGRQDATRAVAPSHRTSTRRARCGRSSHRPEPSTMAVRVL